MTETIMTADLNRKRATELLQNLRATRLHTLEAMVEQLETDQERGLPDQGIMAFLAALQGTIVALEAACDGNSDDSAPVVRRDD